MNFNKVIWGIVMIPGFLFAMDVPNLTVEDFFSGRDVAYEKAYGAQRIDDSLIKQDFEEVRNHYAKHNFFTGPVAIRFFNQEAVKQLDQEGYTASYPAVTNGKNMIHLHKDYTKVPRDERKQALAHEFAHIVINRYSILNPHCWLEKIVTHVPVMAFAAAQMASGLIIYSDRKNGSPIAVNRCARIGGFLYAAVLPLFGIQAYISKHFAVDDPNSPCTLRYPFMDKQEEIICDVIAACIMPNGAAAGKRLFTRRIEKDGDMNGANGSHPWTSTRVSYHDWINTIQKARNILSDKQGVNKQQKKFDSMINKI